MRKQLLDSKTHALCVGMSGKSICLAMAICLLSLAASAGALPEPAQQLLDEGFELINQGDSKAAVKVLKRALAKSGDESCGMCHLGLARSYNRMGAYKDGRKAAAAAVPLLAGGDYEAAAQNALGSAIFSAADDDADELGQAADCFRKALELTGGAANNVRYNLAEVLLKLGQDEEGVALLEKYLEVEPAVANAARARSLIAMPERARRPVVPNFEGVTLEGELVSYADMKGKVVLLDFWATWCAPCIEAMPSLKRLNRKLADEPFVLLGINIDSDKNILPAFLEKRGVDWMQIWDNEMAITRDAFGVSSYPTYILIDHTGEVIYRFSGGSSMIDTEVSRRAKKATRAAKKAAASVR